MPNVKPWSTTPPHVGGPVTGPGVPTVLAAGKPVAVVGDMCTCMGPPDTIVEGVPTVLAAGKPVATTGSMTAHGGSIIDGEPTILVGTGTSAKTVITPIEDIPFPKINATLTALAAISGRSKKLKEAKEKIEQVKKEAKKQGYLGSFNFSL